MRQRWLNRNVEADAECPVSSGQGQSITRFLVCLGPPSAYRKIGQGVVSGETCCCCCCCCRRRSPQMFLARSNADEGELRPPHTPCCSKAFSWKSKGEHHLRGPLHCRPWLDPSTGRAWSWVQEEVVGAYYCTGVDQTMPQRPSVLLSNLTEGRARDRGGRVFCRPKALGGRSPPLPTFSIIIVAGANFSLRHAKRLFRRTPNL
jgi:hypothetical protein